MNQIFVVLGSNIDKEENLPLAVRFLSKMCHVVAISSVYETLPVGLSDQPNFFNAAVLVETEMDPTQFKEEILSKIERRLQRQRTADKNAPRTIDADIVLFNDEVLEYGRPGGRRRHLPDPDLLEFAHVAVPVAELAPETPHPETGETLAAIAGRLLVSRQGQIDSSHLRMRTPHFTLDETLAIAAQNNEPPLWKRPDILLLSGDEDSCVKRKT